MTPGKWALVGLGMLAAVSIVALASAQEHSRPADRREPAPPAGWQRMDLQGLSLAVPEKWSMISGQPRSGQPAPFGGAVFAERPGAIESGGLLVLAAGVSAAGYADGLDADDMLGAGMAMIDGRRAGRVDFALKNRRNDTRGFDIQLEGADGRRELVLTCRGPSAQWRRLESVCQRIVASVELRPPAKSQKTVATVAPVAPPTSETKVAPDAGDPGQPAATGMVPPSGAITTIVPGQPAAAWRSTSWARGNPAFVTRGKDALVIEYPAGAGGGGAGVISTATPVRLGDLAAGAQTRITFRFDPARTNGFRISLCPARLDNCWSERGYTLFWHTGGDGRARLLRKSNDGKHREIAIGAVPSQVTLLLSKAGVGISGDGFAPVTDDWELLAPFLAFEIEVQAMPLTEAAPSRLALRAIEIEQRQAERVMPSAPAAGVAPLPGKVHFDGRLSTGWSPYATTGGDFAAFARVTGGALAIDVPVGRRRGITGIASNEPLVDVPLRAALAPRRLAIEIDPAKTTAFAVILSDARAPADDWLQSKVWLHWSRRDDGGGEVKLANCASASREARMQTPPGWTGNLEVLLRPGLVEVGLDSHWRMAAGSPCVADGNRLFVSVVAAPRAENAAAHLRLARIEVDRVPPDGMTRQQRFELIDDADFDAVDFLADLAKDDDR